MFLFFFFKQKTAYEMRISDWSSDVCSSDLAVGLRGAPGVEFLRQFGVMSREQRGGEQAGIGRACLADREGRDGDAAGHLDDRKQAVHAAERRQIGRAHV